MSQQGGLTTSGSGSSPIETLTGNSGGPVGPDGAFNINILGNNTTGINVVGMPGTSTLSIVGIQATTTQRGTVTLATNAETITGTDTSKVITPDDLTAKLGVQTLHGLPIGAGSTSALVWSAAPTDGQLLIGNTGNDPTLGNITSTGGTITVTNGPGTINLDLAGGGIAFDQIFVDSVTAPGVNPVVPTGTGQLTMTGSQVATGTIGTNVVRTASLNASELTVEIQRSTAVAATDITKNGVAHFNSAQFTLDANGFVSTSGTGILNTLTGNSGGALSPTAGNINTIGTGSITIAGSGSTLTTQLTGLTNHAVQVGAGTATLTQLAVGSNGQVLVGATAANPAFATLTSSDSSISFTTGANTLSLQVAGGSTTIKTITGNSGGAESPSAGNFNILGTGSITVVGSANTETVQLTGLTNHALQIGAGTATLTQLASGTTGQVLQTNTGADPTWSTATYPSTTTINQVLYSSANNVVAGITAANNGTLISGTTGIPSWLANGTTGQVLTATTGSPPSWAAASSTGFTTINVQTFTSNGTYTPTANMKYCIIEVVGGGGGGGGVPTTSGTAAAAGGGGGGGYAKKFASAATIGASQSVTVGGGGAGGASGGTNTGTTGSTTSVGAIVSATGGVGGVGGTVAAGAGTASVSSGGLGGTGSSGDVNASGGCGGVSFGQFTSGVNAWVFGGVGGKSIYGSGGVAIFNVGSGTTAGSAGVVYGGGGAGAVGLLTAGSSSAGGNGAAGIVIITEYI